MISEERNLILSLQKDFIYGELLDVKYFIQKDFSLLKNKMNEIRKNNENYFKSLREREYCSKISGIGKQNIEDIRIEQNNYGKIIRRALRTGTFEYGDQFYRLEMVEKIISLAREKGHIDQVPQIFVELENIIAESKKLKK